MKDTIFALSSGAPPAAIAVVRISGPKADDALQALAGDLPQPRTAVLKRLQGPSGLLDTALVKAQDAQTSALVAGKEVAASANDYVKENPWRAIAAAAGVGLLAGVILGRK